MAAVDGVMRDPAGVARLIASMARNVATTASFSELAAETAGDQPLNRTVVSHYRDSDQLEADVVIEARDGRWIAAEVGLGGERDIEQAAQSLRRLREKVDTSRAGEPARLLIITSAGYGYDRPDGSTVVPITALGP